MGNAFFENYTITLDWDNDNLILDKVNDYGFSNSPIFEVGFFADLEKGIVTIANIYEKSELFGKIQPNTKVLEINNIDLISLQEAGQLCEFWHKKWNQFSKNDELNLVVETNGTPESLKVKKIQW